MGYRVAPSCRKKDMAIGKLSTVPDVLSSISCIVVEAAILRRDNDHISLTRDLWPTCMPQSIQRDVADDYILYIGNYIIFLYYFSDRIFLSFFLSSNSSSSIKSVIEYTALWQTLSQMTTCLLILLDSCRNASTCRCRGFIPFPALL